MPLVLIPSKLHIKKQTLKVSRLFFFFCGRDGVFSSSKNSSLLARGEERRKGQFVSFFLFFLVSWTIFTDKDNL